jgi:hypothetical protein
MVATGRKLFVNPAKMRMSRPIPRCTTCLIRAGRRAPLLSKVSLISDSHRIRHDRPARRLAGHRDSPTLVIKFRNRVRVRIDGRCNCFASVRWPLTRAVHRALPRLGIPTQLIDPSVSRAAVLHGFAGTIFVETRSSAGMAKPVRELVWSCVEFPCTAPGATGADCPAIGGEGAPTLPLGPGLGPPLPTFGFGATPPPAAPRGAELMPEELLKSLLLLMPPVV